MSAAPAPLRISTSAGACGLQHRATGVRPVAGPLLVQPVFEELRLDAPLQPPVAQPVEADPPTVVVRCGQQRGGLEGKIGPSHRQPGRTHRRRDDVAGSEADRQVFRLAAPANLAQVDLDTASATGHVLDPEGRRQVPARDSSPDSPSRATARSRRNSDGLSMLTRSSVSRAVPSSVRSSRTRQARV